MTGTEGYLGFLLLLVFAGATAGGMVLITQWLGPKGGGSVHEMPFECGNEPAEIRRGRISVKFFLAALLFVLFDVELIFLFPWAVVYRELGWFGFFEMLIFLLVVLSGLYYSVKRGALDWK
ncbi:MAG: NADH-quinone oxidoreductase subunit A [Candidatus Aminicenantes bacterium]|nr:NADH-quinone oxidoreductase subunit A [Candidatus Aminicenantes bacterium]